MSRYHEEQALLEATLGAMSNKLHLNHHKRSWRREPYEELLKRLREEVDELGEVLRAAPKRGEVADWKMVIDEAADVANFAGMIIDSVYHDRGTDIPRPPEGDRWRDRIKLLERRAYRAWAILEGRPDPHPKDDDDD